MDRRGDDVARRLVAELDDVFAEIGLDRRDAVRLEVIVERDLLGDHRLALGDGLGADGAADRRAPPRAPPRRRAPNAPRRRARRRSARKVRGRNRDGRGVVLDRLGRHRAAPRTRAGARSPRRGAAENPLPRHEPSARCRFGSPSAGAGVRGKGAAGRFHQRSGRFRRRRSPASSVMPASTSATWRASTALPAPRQLAGDVEQAAEIAGEHRYRRRSRRCRRPCRSTILSEISGYLTQNVPPKPQQTSAPGNSRSVQPLDRGEQAARLSP